MDVYVKKIKIIKNNYFELITKTFNDSQFSIDTIINCLIEKHIDSISLNDLKEIDLKFKNHRVRKMDYITPRKSGKEKNQKEIWNYYQESNSIEKTQEKYNITHNQLSYIIRKYQEYTPTEILEERNYNIRLEFLKSPDKKKAKKILMEKYKIARSQLNRILKEPV